eukprot:303272_1
MCNLETFKTLSEYGKKICNVYFQNVKKITVNYAEWEKFMATMQGFTHFVDTECKFLRLEVLIMLFPNVEHINVYGINLSDSIFDIIQMFFTKYYDKSHKTAIKKLYINTNQVSNQAISKMLIKYIVLFKQINIFIGNTLYPYAGEQYSWIEFHKCRPIDFAAYLTEKMFWVPFEDLDCTIRNIAYQLIERRVTVVSNTSNGIADQQRMFEQCLDTKTSLVIEWNVAQKQLGRVGRWFCQTEKEWVKLDALIRLFPNLQKVNIYGINLCVSTMDDILKYLIEDQMKSLSIGIIAKNKSDLSTVDAVDQYTKQLKAINFSIKADHDNTRQLDINMLKQWEINTDNN